MRREGQDGAMAVTPNSHPDAAARMASLMSTAKRVPLKSFGYFECI